LSQSLNIETLNFDQNNIGSIFIVNLVNKLIQNKKNNVNKSEKLYQDENIGNDSKNSSFMAESD
jgi:hypothetical protein